MDYTKNMEHNDNFVHFASLVYLAYVDGEPSPEEMEILAGFSTKLGVNEQEVEQIVSNPEKYRVRPMKSRTERLHYIFDLFRIIYADYKLNIDEYDFVRAYIKTLGFNSLETQKIMNKTIAFFENAIDIEDYENMIFGGGTSESPTSS